jgi:nucleosome binding factor SPN SPT16 subunit
MYIYIANHYGKWEEAFPTHPEAIKYIMSQEDMVFYSVDAYNIEGKIKQISKDTHQLIREWDSIFEAAEECTINVLDIFKCLMGSIEHAGGFEWTLSDMD